MAWGKAEGLKRVPGAALPVTATTGVGAAIGTLIMRKGLFLCVIGFAAIVTITSCTSFQVSGVEIHQTTTEGTVIGDLNIKVRIHKFLGNSGGRNLFNVSSEATDPVITEAIRTEIQNQGGTSAVNVKIVYKATFVNMLLNGISSSIYAPATAYITGTIIK